MFTNKIMPQPPTAMKCFKQYSIIDSYGNMTVSVKKTVLKERLHSEGGKM